jgi:hypothetical protein
VTDLVEMKIVGQLPDGSNYESEIVEIPYERVEEWWWVWVPWGLPLMVIIVAGVITKRKLDAPYIVKGKVTVTKWDTDRQSDVEVASAYLGAGKLKKKRVTLGAKGADIVLPGETMKIVAAIFREAERVGMEGEGTRRVTLEVPGAKQPDQRSKKKQVQKKFNLVLATFDEKGKIENKRAVITDQSMLIRGKDAKGRPIQYNLTYSER